MKREKFLREMAADHHHALLFCLLIREAAKTVAGDGRGGLLEDLSRKTARFFHEELEPHCEAEERIIRIFGRHVGENDGDLRRMEKDHAELKALVREGSLQSLKKFAEKLEDHIHFEDGLLYFRLEQNLTPEEKEGIGIFLESRHSKSANLLNKEFSP